MAKSTLRTVATFGRLLLEVSTLKRDWNPRHVPVFLRVERGFWVGGFRFSW